MKTYGYAIIAVILAVAITGLSSGPFPAVSKAATTDTTVTTCSNPDPCISARNFSSGPAIRGRSERGNGIEGVSVIFGSSTSPLGNAGVKGRDVSQNGAAETFGVLGVSKHAIGVGGLTSSLSGFPAVAGAVNMPGNQSAAIFGTNATSIGTLGMSDNGQAMFAMTLNGEALFAAGRHGVGVVAENNSPTNTTVAVANNSATGPLLLGYNHTSLVASLDNAGNLTIAGNLKTGTPPMITIHGSHGSVMAYGAAQTIPTIDDVGEAQLQGGQATVRFDPTFASAIDSTRPYLVFITPQGETHGMLYVAQKNSFGFVVRENQLGRSSVAFAYRVVATPFGTRASRLPATMPQAASADLTRFGRGEQRIPLIQHMANMLSTN